METMNTEETIQEMVVPEEVLPERALEARERAVTLREMKLSAERMLRERALPETLAGVLSYESPEGLSASIDQAEQAFRMAVERGVLDRMRGTAPARAPATREPGEMNDEDYYHLLYAKADNR